MGNLINSNNSDKDIAWNNFLQSGKISDYLQYTQSTKSTQVKPQQTTSSTISKVGADATQDKGDYTQTT